MKTLAFIVAATIFQAVGDAVLEAFPPILNPLHDEAPKSFHEKAGPSQE